MDKVHDYFQSLLADKGITLTQTQLDQYEQYFRLLVEWNERMNLTGITEREQVYVKHFYDSLSLAFFVNMDKVTSIADIGSGAGFPSIPLKIAYPHLKVTIIDSLNKRIQFLNTLAGELGLHQVTCIHGRAEDLAREKKLRDSFDLVTARAVARLNALNELCLPFARVGGLFAAMKGAQGAEELAEASYSYKELNAKHRETHEFQLPMEEAQRHILLAEKVAPTPAKYPRKAGIPLKQPLGATK